LVGLVLLLELWRRGAWRPLRAWRARASRGVIRGGGGQLVRRRPGARGVRLLPQQIILENVLRFLPYEEGGPSRKHAVVFYLPMLLTGMLPWSLGLPHALQRGFRERRSCRPILGVFACVVQSSCSPSARSLRQANELSLARISAGCIVESAA